MTKKNKIKYFTFFCEACGTFQVFHGIL